MRGMALIKPPIANLGLLKLPLLIALSLDVPYVATAFARTMTAIHQDASSKPDGEHKYDDQRDAV